MKAHNYLSKLFVQLVVFCVLMWVDAFSSGTYGPNKVQYFPFDWRVVQTTHFDIHYSQEGDSLAHYAASHLENMYKSSALFLGTRLQQRIPVILHNTHAQFSQTNVVRFPIPEAVGGFTEVFKNRIVMPFDGSYASFHHVLHHELLHALVFDLLSGGGRGLSTAQRLGNLPLWLHEGLSEFSARGWDVESEFFVMDAVTSGYAISPVHDIQGFFAYKGGQNFLFFLESAFGVGTVRSLFAQIKKGYAFADAFRRVTRITLEEAGEIWLRELRRIYWPELGQRTYAKNIARALTDHRKDKSFYNVAPSLSPDGSKLAFFSDRGNWEAAYILDIASEKVKTTLLEAGRAGNHESFQPFRSSLSWSPDGERLVLVSRQGGGAVLHIVDADRARVLQVLRPELEAISSPAWSPDGASVVFVGQRLGQSNLYRMPLDGSNQLEQLTTNVAAPGRPSISPSGRFVAFHADAAPWMSDSANPHRTHLLLLDLQTKNTRVLAPTRWNNRTPAFGPSDSLLVFVSNRSGVDNIYLTEVFGDSLWSLTNVLSSAQSPTWSKDGNLLAFTVFEGGGFDIFLMRNPLENRSSQPLPRSRFVQLAEDSLSLRSFFRSVAIENLKSYKDTASLDTLRPTLRPALDTARIAVTPPEEDDLFLRPPRPRPNPPPPVTNKNDSLIGDSLPAPVTAKVAPVDTAQLPRAADPAKSFTETGELRSNPYQTKWSLDQAMAMAGFSNVQGVGGQGLLTFSDLLGDQEFSLWFFSGGGNVENINIFASYGYLPLRPDFRIHGFHTYRQGRETMSRSRWEDLWGVDSGGNMGGSDIGWVPYGDRHYGLGGSVTWPFSLFSRLRLEGDLSWRERNYLRYKNNGELVPDERVNTLELHSLQSTLSWSFDNAQWGAVGPVLGERLWLAAHILPPLLQKGVGYWKTEMDMRKYWRLGKRYTFALRGAAGMSEALGSVRNPHVYLVGGDDFTLNWLFNDGNWNNNQDEVFFASWETPLRGFRYHEFRGTRMALLNAEFRYPFIEYLVFGWPIPLAFRNVTGVLFSDYGGTWENRNYMENVGLGYGFGMRLNLGIFVLRYTRAWSNHSVSTINQGPRTYWSLGAEF